jgi:tRNA/rRNA methyltransferase
MNEYLNNLYVVMVEPKNAGNIGAAVRAMKNMGISHLRLVNPVEFRDVAEQRKMGYRSQEIIESCVEFETLADAVADISLVFLATSKKGKWKKDFPSPEKAAEIVSEYIPIQKVAIVFGREDSGVTIDESQLANYYIHIPSAVTYPSLNLSQAVLVVLYEIYKKVCNKHNHTTLPKMAERKSFERLNDNIWGLIQDLEIREDENGLFHRSLKRCLNRTHWTNADIAVFDRFCKQVRWYVDNRMGVVPESASSQENPVEFCDADMKED